MNHPYEQLADLMDGTLDERELAGVQAHLDSCATCRQDIDLATHGVRAARSLPRREPSSGSASARRGSRRAAAAPRRGTAGRVRPRPPPR